MTDREITNRNHAPRGKEAINMRSIEPKSTEVNPRALALYRALYEPDGIIVPDLWVYDVPRVGHLLDELRDARLISVKFAGDAVNFELTFLGGDL